MSPSDLLSLASVIISILAVLYARRALQFEKEKFKVEQEKFKAEEVRYQERKAQERISLNILKIHDHIDDNALLIRILFSIVNQLPREAVIHHVCVRLIFIQRRYTDINLLDVLKKFFSGRLHETRNSFELTISIDTNESLTTMHTSGFDQNVHYSEFEIYEDACRAIVRDLKTKKPVLDTAGWTSIEPSTKTHLWETIAVVPLSACNELEKQGYIFSKVGIEIELQGGDKVTSTAGVFSFAIETSNITEEPEINRIIQKFKVAIRLKEMLVHPSPSFGNPDNEQDYPNQKAG